MTSPDRSTPPTDARELRELDARVASALFNWWPVGIVTRPGGGPAAIGFPPDCPRSLGDVVPRFSSDWSAIRLVEDEIERRGLGSEYIRQIVGIVYARDVTPDDEPMYDDEIFTLFRASCEQRAKAACKIVNDKGSQTP